MTSMPLLIIEAILCLITQIFLYRQYKKIGIYIYIVIALILASLMSLKTINIYNFDLNLGVIPFVSLFTSSNILIQKNGPESTKELIILITTTFFISYAIIFLVKMMDSSNINLFTNASFDNIFNESLRMIFTNFVSLLYSILLNSKLYYYLKKMKNNIMISNVFSTIIIQFIASILFGITAFIFTKDLIDIIKLIMIRYLVSLIVGILGTISLYMTKKVTE